MGASSAGGAVLSVPFSRMAATDLHERGVEQKGTGAGGVDALLAIALDQPENADGGAEALFQMRPRPQDDVDQGVGVGADLGGLGTNTLMGPVAKTAMRARHMLGNRRRAMRQGAAQMRRHPLTAEENLDGLLSDASLDLLMHEVVRDAVVVPGDLDVIIEVDPAALPLRTLVRFIRQGGERRTIEVLEQVAPTSPQLRRGGSFSSTRSVCIASLRAVSEKKRRLRKRARIHRPTSWTPTSTLALSLGRYETMAVR